MADYYTTFNILVGPGGVVGPGSFIYGPILYPSAGQYNLVYFSISNDSSAVVIDGVDVAATTSTYQYNYGYYYYNNDTGNYSSVVNQGTGVQTSQPLTLAGQSNQLGALAANQTLDVNATYTVIGESSYNNYPSSFGLTPFDITWHVDFHFIGTHDAPVLTANSTVMGSELNAGAPGTGLTTAVFQLTSATTADNGAQKGIAITGADNSNGTWFYSTDYGVHWSQIGTVSDSSALLLSSNAYIHFDPNANFAGTPAITFRAWDQTQGTAGQKFNISTNGTGGTTAFSATTETASVHVLQTHFTVTDEASLNQAIQWIDSGGTDALTNTAYTINFNLPQADGHTLKLTSPLDAINLLSGSSLTINGLDSGVADTIDGGGAERGLFVYAGKVTVDDLTIANVQALGGAGGGGGGGGGAGLGGGLFVASGASVTLNDVSFHGDQATGGAGGSGGAAGGGGGMGGAGAARGGGGGLGAGANGAGYTAGVGIIPNLPATPYNQSGGGGGGAQGFSVGGYGGGVGPTGSGFNGGFGGGGGGGVYGGGSGGFGGGGGGGEGFGHFYGSGTGGNGGFGGGGGGGGNVYGGAGGLGGFGAGNGAGNGGAGGGGLGAGGDIFVQSGGSLTIAGGTLEDGTVNRSGGANEGEAYGSGIFLQGNQSITFGAGQTAGQTTTINGDITDQSGSDPGNAIYNDPGAGSVVIAGAGTVVLGGDNSYTGGTTVQGGTLQISAGDNLGGGTVALNSGTILDALVNQGSTILSAPITGSGRFAKDGAGTIVLGGNNSYTAGTTINSGVLEIGTNGSAGSGTITFGGPSATLRLDATPVSGSTYADQLSNIGTGDQLDLHGMAFAAGATAVLSGSTLTVHSGTSSENFTLVNPGVSNFAVTSDGSGATPGVLLTAAGPTISGTVANQSTTSEAPVHPFSGVTISDTSANATETLTITLSGNGGTLTGTGLSGGNGTYTLAAGTAADVTAELRGLVFTPFGGMPNAPSITTFALSDTSSAFGTPATASTTVTDTRHTTATLLNPGGAPITTVAQLNAAIIAADGEAANSGAYEIVLGANASIGLTTAIEAINLKSGVTLDIVGDGATLDGKNESTGASYNQRGLFVYSGVVNIDNLTLSETRAVGGAGGAGSVGGGGGAGLGGGLFIAGSHDPGQAVTPIVTLNSVGFTLDSATGGAGGQSGLYNTHTGANAGPGGGGGLGGSGGTANWDGTGQNGEGDGGGGGIGGAGGGAAGRTGVSGILPVCFKAGSIGEGRPQRDLWISPRHAMYFEDQGVLIEAKDLVNGVSIVQAEHVDEVEYFHIELDSHDVIIAEGALSESFVDDDSRGMFHNADDYARLYPEDIRRAARYCAPRLEIGYEVEAIRRKLAERAQLASDEQDAGTLRGSVDAVSPYLVEGWAQSVEHPEVPICLDIYAGGQLIGQTLANAYRADLEGAGLGSGRHSFSFAVPDGLVLLPGTIEVRRSLDGAPLPASRASNVARVAAMRA